MTTREVSPTASDLRFWDRIADRYAKRPVADQQTYEKKLRLTRARLRPEMTVLELGCGTGSTALAHAPFVASIRATDIAPKMIEIGRRKAAEAGVENVVFEAGSVETLSVAPNSVDVALGLNLLHLLRAPDAAIGRIHGWLKPGGLFISSTACLSDGYGWLRPIAPVARRLGQFPYLSFFSERRLQDMMTRAGFEIEERWRPSKRAASFMIARR